MNDPLNTYLQDHLAGARFAIELLTDLRNQSANLPVAQLAERLLAEITDDCLSLQAIANKNGGDSHQIKQAAAWVAQKASRLKLNLNEPVGIFEAVEMLTIGVQGKLALWNALRVITDSDSEFAGLDLETLTSRAIQQFRQLEEVRLQLAVLVLTNRATPVDRSSS